MNLSSFHVWRCVLYATRVEVTGILSLSSSLKQSFHLFIISKKLVLNFQDNRETLLWVAKYSFYTEILENVSIKCCSILSCSCTGVEIITRILLFVSFLW